ncbi:hypothetical protein, partial [Pseudomonas aeruginosa]
APIERHAHGLQAKICCSCSWLHFLKSWSLLKTRGDSGTKAATTRAKKMLEIANDLRALLGEQEEGNDVSNHQ